MTVNFYRKATAAGIYEGFGIELRDGDGGLVVRIPAIDEDSAHSMMTSIIENSDVVGRA